MTPRAALRPTGIRHGLDAVGNHEPTYWLRGRILDLIARYETAQIGQCGHLIGGMTGWAALSDVQHVACTTCARTLLGIGAPALECDRCGKSGETRPGSIAPAPWFLVTFQLCADCHDREVPSR